MYAERTLSAHADAPACRVVSAKSPDVMGDLQYLFKAYDAASLDFDADSVAAFYDLPCLISAPDGNGSFTARGEIRAAFARAFAGYRQRGIVSATMVSLTLKSLSEDFAMALVTWSLSNARGMDISQLDNMYTLRRVGMQWRISCTLTLRS
jgi:hypothetical protein